MTFSNPFASTDRCTSTNVSLDVFFRTQRRELFKEDLVLQVNPLANKCLGGTEMRTHPKSEHFTVDLSQGIPKKLWEICVHRVHFEDQNGIKYLDPKQAVFETNLCKTEKLQIHYSLYGGKKHTRALFCPKMSINSVQVFRS